jgi:death-on-curing protein
MISFEDAQQIHDILIKRYGGTAGIRDVQSLKSALIRPFQIFENVDLYPDILSKATALIESIIVNHPFIDGNKRTGYVLMRLFLINNKIDINATEDEKYDFVIKIASGNSDYDEILDWLKAHTLKINE